MKLFTCTGPVEAKSNCSGRVRLRVKIFQILCSEIASEAIFGPFFCLICSSWQAEFWFNLGRPCKSPCTCVEYMVWFEHHVYFCISSRLSPHVHQKVGRGRENKAYTKLLPLMRPQGQGFQFRNLCSCANDERYSQGWTMLFAQPQQAKNAAARAILCYINLAIIQHLACRWQVCIFLACTSTWPLKKSWKVSKIGPPKAWATGPALPAQLQVFHMSVRVKNLILALSITYWTCR